MNKLYPSFRLMLAVLAILTNITLLQAQSLNMSINNTDAMVSGGGTLFSNPTSISTLQPGTFLTPKTLGVSAIFTQALWMTGLDAHDSLHCAGQQYYEYGSDYFNGPIVDTMSNYYETFYDRLFPVYGSEVTSFRLHTFPVTTTEVPDDILYWPAKGNAAILSQYHINITSNLAPFVDLNNNGIYEPLLGDYPATCAPMSVFFVFNDAAKQHGETGGTPLGIEVRGLASAYLPGYNGSQYDPDVVDNTIYVQYEIENKSVNNYTSFYLGQWLDPDLGCNTNDFAGCDTSKNLMFDYNAESYDADCGNLLGYGSLPIALGVKLLNQQMNVFGTYTNSSNPNTSGPQTPAQYQNYLQGFWADGTPFTYGETGYAIGNTDTAKFMFSGNPNDAAAWSERYPQNGVLIDPSDVVMYASTGPLNFNAGEIKKFDYAFFTSFDTLSNNFTIVDTLIREADSAQSYYNRVIIPCQSLATTGIKQVPTGIETVSVYPNPTHDRIIITCSDNIQTVELTDIEGRMILTKPVEAQQVTIPVLNLAKGLYLVTVLCDGNLVVKKIVVE